MGLADQLAAFEQALDHAVNIAFDGLPVESLPLQAEAVITGLHSKVDQIGAEHLAAPIVQPAEIAAPPAAEGLPPVPAEPPSTEAPGSSSVPPDVVPAEQAVGDAPGVDPSIAAPVWPPQTSVEPSSGGSTPPADPAAGTPVPPAELGVAGAAAGVSTNPDGSPAADATSADTPLVERVGALEQREAELEAKEAALEAEIAAQHPAGS